MYPFGAVCHVRIKCGLEKGAASITNGAEAITSNLLEPAYHTLHGGKVGPIGRSAGPGPTVDRIGNSVDVRNHSLGSSTTSLTTTTCPLYAVKMHHYGDCFPPFSEEEPLSARIHEHFEYIVHQYWSQGPPVYGRN
jgi:hypothetical protein